MRSFIILLVILGSCFNSFSQVLFDQSYSPPAIKWRSVIGSQGFRLGYPEEAGLSEDWSYDITNSFYQGDFDGYVTCGYAKTLNSLGSDPTKCDGMEGDPDFNELENWYRRKGLLRPKFMKVNQKGELVWYKVMDNGVILDGELFSLKQTSDGGYIGVGQASFNGSNIYNPTNNSVGSIAQSNRDGKSGLIVKINSSGNTEWFYAYGLSDNLNAQSIDYPNNAARRTSLHDIVETNSGNFIAVGYSSISSEISGRKSVFILNVNSQGLINWKTSYIPSTAANMEFFGNSINKDGNEYIIGGMHINRLNNTNYKPFF